MRAAIPVGTQLVVLADSEQLALLNLQFDRLHLFQFTELAQQYFSL